MARPRLPDRPPNGTGFGTNPKRNVSRLNSDSSYLTLVKPFKIPVKNKLSSSSGRIDKNVPIQMLARPSRLAKLKAVQVLHDLNANMLGDPANDNETMLDENYDDSGNGGSMKRIDALSVSRYMKDSSRIQIKLSSKFSIPIKNYVRSHNLTLQLGMKPNALDNLPPRPLHDPYGELAIVLYDPTVDGDMPDCEPEKPIIPEPVVNNKNKKKNTDQDGGKETENHTEVKSESQESIKRFKITGLTAKKLSNGIRNKPLSEMLKPVYSISSADLEAVKHPNVPVVIDPKLSKILRPHQVEGVRFLYRCVTGLVVKDFMKNKELAATLNLPDIDTVDTPPIEPLLEDETKLDMTKEEEKEETQGNDEKRKKKKRLSKKEREEAKLAEPALEEALPNAEPKKKKKISKKKEEARLEEARLEEARANAEPKNAYGCIMADEMGLGKTLQCLALLWTLMKQGPRGVPMIDKAIITCPSSLVSNWANEIIKWLGPGVLTPMAIDGKKHSTNGMTVGNAIKQWGAAQGRQITKPVLIISYETLRLNVKNLGDAKVGLMLADEGHRLKNENSLTFLALNNINCNRRVILSGTPIQNDLSEYFALLNFSNPGLLGNRLQFKKNYEAPILLGRDAYASEEEVAKSQKKLHDLSNIVSKFIIRRTNDILAKYLPCKYEHVVFVKPTEFQEKLYNSYTSSTGYATKDKELMSNSSSTPLSAINIMKKICNHPDLINIDEQCPDIDDDIIPADYQPANLQRARSSVVQYWQSGKFSILHRMLHTIRSQSDDKIVIISNYTQTLDLIEILCGNNGYGFIRLDGTQSVNKRQKIVDRFNDPENLNDFIFLLSSKAGGCGINLIGANRLVLLDPDWNPASDQQALARVWRDGQKKDCFIYRFITTGTIEEKIYQRQTMKMSLSSCVVDEKDDVDRLFSGDNLRELYQYKKNTVCDTHDTFKCKRCKNGVQQVRSTAMLYGDATTWNHLNHKALKTTNDHLLKNEFEHDQISFVFQYISHT